MGGNFLLTIEGKENVYISGNPNVTFFKSIYKQYNPFSIENVRLEYDGVISSNNTLTFRVPNNADLLHRCFLSFYISEGSGDIYSYFKKIDIEIGGTIVDSITSWGLYLYHEKYSTSEQYLSIEDMANYRRDVIYNREILIPLSFFFCKNPGRSLPLSSITQDTIRFVLHLSGNKEYTSSANNIPIPYIWCEYIYLSKQESQKFIDNEHVLLIEQIQKTQEEKITTSNHKVKLTFKHLVKEIFWVFVDNYPSTQISLFEDGDTSIIGGSHYINEHGDRSGVSQFDYAHLMINGTNLFVPRNQQYYSFLSYYNYFNRRPLIDIFSHSFSINPHDYQPNGIVNFNNINTSHIQFENIQYPQWKLPITASHPDFNPNISGDQFIFSERYIAVFASNYNILRIKNGRALLAFI